MKNFKKIMICMIMIIFSCNYNSYAMYQYHYVIPAFSFTRDASEITYVLRKSPEQQYTNSNVILEIETNKAVENIDGFTLSEDGKLLKKVFSENASDTIILEDISGNKKEVNYTIDNIDKIPPEIVGIENGKTYSTNLKPNYTDNTGIANIQIEKYDSSLAVLCYPDYYDSDLYKGIDVTKNTIHVTVTSRPKNTVKYRYYLNNSLKKETPEREYTYTGLSVATSYTVKIEAIDATGKVVGTTSQTIKTKYFGSIEATKTGSTFNVTVKGLDSSVKKVIVTKFSASNRAKIKYVSTAINSDRSATSSLVATDITSTVESGYYYLQFHLKDGSDNTLETANCNIVFNKSYVKPSYNVDPYNITQNGSYVVVVTDLAGNQTKKEFTLKK